MDFGLTTGGLILALAGTLLVLGFRPDPGSDDTKMGRAGEHILGTSRVSSFWNDTVVPVIFGGRFFTRALPESEWRALTVQAEIRITRLGWTAIVAGGLLQIVGQL